jgi:putative membrane protein
MEHCAEFLRLLGGTVIYRPYVYAFFTCFLVYAIYHLGWKRMLTFMVTTWIIAFASEYSTTRNGFPFGPYSYFDVTRTRELWISNIPFWDSLSFVFLSYFSFVMAAAIVSGPADIVSGHWHGSRSRLTPLLGGCIMMLLDVVIDPVTLQGDKWFLGRIYEYPYRGFYFGVTAANFAGWFFVGYVSQWLLQRMMDYAPWCQGEFRTIHPWFVWLVYAVYGGVFIFNLGITIYIRDYTLSGASAVVSTVTMVVIALLLRRKPTRNCNDCS